jgi:hypothetical protein
LALAIERWRSLEVEVELCMANEIIAALQARITNLKEQKAARCLEYLMMARLR